MKNRLLKTVCAVFLAGTAALSMASCGSSEGGNAGTPEKAASVKANTPEGYQLLWNDEFDGKTLNEEIWSREYRKSGWTNEELQEYRYDEANGFMRDGKFVIKGTHENGSYASCKLNSRDKAQFKYGYVKVRAKAPSGKGLLPAIWMMPNNEGKYGSWPRCGEIDIMEVLGDKTDKTYGTIHYGNPHKQNQGSYTLDGKSFADEFHEYAIEWDPGKITWFVDGIKFYETSDWYTGTNLDTAKPFPAPFNQDFQIQINLAIGGTWPGNPDPDADTSTWEFEIDYVRVYQRTEGYDENVTKPSDGVDTSSFRQADSTGNFITNSDFSDTSESLTDTKGWQFVQTEGGAGSVTLADGKATIKTTNAGNQDYSIQFLHNEMPIEKGQKYKVTFDIWADEARKANEICVTQPNSNYNRVWSKTNFDITTTKTTYSYEFTPSNMAASDGKCRLEFNLGHTSSKANVYISNVRVEKA